MGMRVSKKNVYAVQNKVKNSLSQTTKVEPRNNNRNTWKTQEHNILALKKKKNLNKEKKKYFW